MGQQTQNADGSVTLRLVHPVTVAGETIEELRVKRPKGRSWRRVALDIGGGGTRLELGAMLEVLADCAGVSSLVVDELDTVDTFAAVEVLTGFFEPGRATGG